MIQIAMEAARRAAILKEDRRDFRIGAIALRRDGARVFAYNGSVSTFTRQAKYIPTFGAHAEVRLSKKIDKGSIIFVARVRKDGTFGLAKPCENCEAVLRAKKVKKVYYTTDQGTWEVIDFMN